MTIRPHGSLEEKTPYLSEISPPSSPEHIVKKQRPGSLESASSLTQTTQQHAIEKIALLKELEQAPSELDQTRISYPPLIKQEVINDTSSLMSSYDEFTLESSMLEPHLSLNGVYAISKEVWIQAIERHPTQAILYCHLARRLDVGEMAQLKNLKPLNARELFSEALKLEPENALICYFFAKKMHDLYSYRKEADPHGSRYNMDFDKSAICYAQIAKKFYKKAILHDPLYFAAYIQAADLLLPQDVLKVDQDTALNPCQLSLKVIQQDPLYGDSYRCFADLSLKNPEYLQLIPGATYQELYLKAIHLDPTSLQAYISLYQAWDRIQAGQENQESLLLLNGECVKKEDLLIKAAMLCSHDLGLKRLYHSSSLISDVCFLPFLEKLSQSLLSSPIKLKTYEILLTCLLYKGEAKNKEEVKNLYQSVQKLLTMIQKEGDSRQHIQYALNEEEMLNQAEAVNQKILSLITRQGYYFDDDEWYKKTWYYTYPEEKKELYPYLGKLFSVKDFRTKDSIALLIRAICDEPYHFRSYAFLADCLDKLYVLHLDTSSLDEYRKKLKGMLYFMSIQLNPSHFAAYCGLYILSSSNKSLAPQDYNIIPEDYGVTLKDCVSLSHKSLFFKIMALMPLTFHPLSIQQNSSILITTRMEFIKNALYRTAETVQRARKTFRIRGNNLQRIKSVTFIQQFLKEGVTFIQQFFKEMEEMPISPQQKHPIYQFFFNHALSMHRTYGDQIKAIGDISVIFPYLKENHQKLYNLRCDAHSHFSENMHYPDPQMINPRSSLKELAKISLETWELILKKNPKNTHFYCNLARVLIDQKYFTHHCKIQEGLGTGASIINLYFKSLDQDPLNIYAYRYLVEFLPLLYDKHYTLISEVLQSINLLILNQNPTEVENILALTKLPMDEKIFTWAKHPPLTQQQLFHQALARDLLDQRLHDTHPCLTVMKEGIFEDQSSIYLETLHHYRDQEPLSYEMFLEKIPDILKKMCKLFPKSILYFNLSNPHYPYLQYDTQQAQFCVSFYEMDVLGGRFEQITGPSVPFDLKKLSDLLL